MDDLKIAVFTDRPRARVMGMAEVQRSHSWRARVPYRLLSLLVSCCLLAGGIAAVGHRVDWRDVTAVWTSLDPRLVALAMAVYWLQYPVNSFRIHRVLLWISGHQRSDTPPLRFLFKLTCSSGFVAVAAPIGLAGDAAKIVALRVFGSLTITDATRVALFDRVVGVQWICIVGLATLPLQTAAGIERDIIAAQFALFAGLIAGVVILLIVPKMLALIRSNFVDRIARILAGYRLLLSPQRSAIQLVIALLGLLCSSGTLYLLFRAAGLNTSVWLVAGFIPLLQLVNSLPFLYMGWGGREIAMAATLGVAGGLTLNETLAVSVAWGVVLIVTGVVNGIFLLGDWQIGTQPEADREADGGAGKIA